MFRVRARRLASFNFSRDVFDKHAAANPDKLAWWRVHAEGEEKKTFSEISQDSKRVANVLHDYGIRRGDTVIVVLPKIYDWWLIFLATLRLGIKISPGSTLLTASDIEYRTAVSSASGVLGDAAVKEKNAQVPFWEVAGPEWATAVAKASDEAPFVDTQDDDPACAFFTSGTTGYPKIALHTMASYGKGHVTTSKWLDLKPDDLHWNMSDLGWAKAAWSSFFSPWTVGSAVFVSDAPFSPKNTVKLLDKYPITTLCAPPTVFRLLISEQFSAPRRALRHCVSAGEPLNPEVIDAWRKMSGIVLCDGYGQTETTLLLGNKPGMEVRPGSAGKPLGQFDVQIVNAEGEICADNEEGDIAVRAIPRPLGLFEGYLDDVERTKKAFRKQWYLTGDRGTRDENGYFWFVGRDDDVISTAGYRVGPFEVESALIKHPQVLESAVIAEPDETRGQIVKAFVILKERVDTAKEDALAKELQNFVKKTMGPYKYPRKIEFVDSLPKTITGKIMRYRLRKQK